MSDNPSVPLLSDGDRPVSKHSHHSDESHEHTPLLSRSSDTPRYDGSDDQGEEHLPSPATASLRSLQQSGHVSSESNKSGRRWPTTVAVSVLGTLVVAIIIGAFFAPAVVEEYAKEALVIEPTKLSIASITTDGVSARVQANFRMDASKVKNKHIRNIGRFGTWIAREVESRSSAVSVYLPEYGNILIGTATVPPVVVDIRNGHTTAIDFISDLVAGDIEGIRQVANDWLEGRLDTIRVIGKADVGLKSGLIPLGTQSISESLVFEGDDLPAIPKYNITKLNFQEVPVSPDGHKGMGANVSLSLINSYPVEFTIPSLEFDILIPGCGVDDSYIQLAKATTATIAVKPKAEVEVDVQGVIRKLPEALKRTCPKSQSSPLDLLLGKYIHGEDTTVFIRGSSSPKGDTPRWITEIISSVTVPVPFPGHTFDNVIKNFSLTDTHFSLPDPLADPDSDDANPQISGQIVVIASLPKEMNFNINVTQVMANATVKYNDKQLGILDLQKWQKAQSERIEPGKGENGTIKIQSRIKNAPLRITDDEVFSDVIQEILFGDSTILLQVEALVDVDVSTVLGRLVIKAMPADGIVPIKPISTGTSFGNLKPKVGELRVLSTGKTSLDLEARVNFTNPTAYTAQVPYVNIHILNNGSIIGDATARNVTVGRGNNTNILVQATWDPTKFGGKEGQKIGRELLSQYISGFNTTLTFQAHANSFPLQPRLGKALSKFLIEIPTPRLSTPGAGGDKGGSNDKPHFIDDAVFHLFSSTAEFTLVSPLQYSTIYIENINATAFYNHTEPIGKINYDLPFKVPPGTSKSPRLPVDWSLDSVGYDKIREALGGSLKLDAMGVVKVRLGQWSESVWYVGSGIGATVKL